MIPEFKKNMQPKTKTQMADEMGICLRTFQRRLEKINLKVPRGLISPILQIKIYEELNWFPKADAEDGCHKKS